MQELAEFGDYEGFNAIVGAPIKENEFDAIEIGITQARRRIPK